VTTRHVRERCAAGYDPRVEFDRFTAVLLITNPDGPKLTEAEDDALQDAHLAFLAELHEAGHLLAAGPVADLPDRHYRGLSILNVDAETAMALKSRDPAVVAGKFTIKVMPWMVPAGAIRYTRTNFPHSIAEATGA
jgi:hypothetical protein